MAEVNVSSLSSSPDFQTSYIEKIQKTLPQVGCSLRCREIIFDIPRILNQTIKSDCVYLYCRWLLKQRGPVGSCSRLHPGWKVVWLSWIVGALMRWTVTIT